MGRTARIRMLKSGSFLCGRKRGDLGGGADAKLASDPDRFEKDLSGKEVGADLAGNIASPLGRRVKVDLGRPVLARFRLGVVRVGAG